MANPFYAGDDRRASRVRDLFAAIAPRYDLINDLQSLGLHRSWKRRLLDLAAVRPGCDALDLCCGTGDVTFALADRGARAVGLDFSGPMLGVAERRAARRAGGAAVRFLRGDAMALPFAAASFDIVTISYGLRNLAGLDEGLAEMWRVCRPGGRIVVLDFDRPSNAAWRAAYLAYLRVFVPLLGRIACGNRDAYAYILESLLHYPGARAVTARLQALGAVDARSFPLLGGVMGISLATRG